MKKIIIAFILVSLVFNLTACPGSNQRAIYLTYNSYEDMLEFASQHYRDCKSDDCELIMFDLEKYDDITLEYYYVSFMWFAKGWDYFAPVVEDKIPAEHFEGHNACKYTMDAVTEEGEALDNAYIIDCYGTYILEYEIENNPSEIIKRELNKKDNADDEYYKSKFLAFGDSGVGIEFNITHYHKATEEELEDIVWVFMNNMLVIE
ncbi:MAG: hypothetical protein IJP20_00240 [Clostridia bacterium]|nr:hypothetical protein [Clostridia bacterium]